MTLNISRKWALALFGAVCLAGAVCRGGEDAPPAKLAPADEKTLAEFRRILPLAAAMYGKVSQDVLLGNRVRLEELKDQRLTPAMLLSRYFAGQEMDMDFVAPEDVVGTAKAIVMKGGATVIKSEDITKLSAELSQDGKVAKGVVEVKNNAFSAAFPFEARKLENGMWQIRAFDLPRTGRRLEIDADGRWRLSAQPTADPLLRLYRAMTAAGPKTLPVAYKAEGVGQEALKPYGQFRAREIKPQPLVDGGKGVLLYVDANVGYEEFLSLSKKGEGEGYCPAAALICGRDGTWVLPLPPVSEAKPQGQKKDDVIEIRLDVAGKEGRLRDTPVIRIKDWETNSVNELTKKLSQLRQVADFSVRILPEPGTPFKHVVSAVDATMWAKIDANTVLVPAVEKKAEGGAERP